MSREIKFRAWSKEEKTMCTKFYDSPYALEIGVINEYLKQPDYLKEYEYMQYIGVPDKSGKEIYEKDIVLIDGEDEYFVVEWDNDTAKFVMNSETLTVDFDNYWGYQVEVVGNVYENADLLKEAGNE